MPHFIMEYSANLDDKLEIPLLFEKLAEAAVATGVFPLAGIRCRAHRCEDYRVADGNPDFGFVHLHVKLGTGRTEQEKEGAAKAVFDTLSAYLQPLYDQSGLAISFEMTELPVSLKYNQNNLRDYIASPANKTEKDHAKC